MHVASRTLFLEVLRRRPCDVKRAIQMNIDYGNPFCVGHFVKYAVPQYPGIVHDAIDTTESVHSHRDHAFRTRWVRYAVKIVNRLTSYATDFGTDVLRGTLIRPVAGRTDAGVIDDNRSAVRRRKQGYLAPYTATGASHDNYIPF